jgi:DNA repair ATPase RecN
MIKQVRVRNFQSLRSIDLEFGKLTVIVGASSSGKSALMRSMRALTSNVRGTSFVTRGSKTAAVAVSLDTGDKVVLERGESSGSYRLALADGTEQTYIKLGGAVPEQVTQALQLLPADKGVSIHFAGQFDRPYLLDDSGSEVARELGELTNVSRIFEAVREANRRRLSTGQELKTREADLEDLKQQTETFRGLPARVKACEEAEAAFQRAVALNQQSSRLRDVMLDLSVAESTVARLSAALPEIPSFDNATAAHNQLSVFKSLIGEWIAANRSYSDANEGVDKWTTEEASLHSELSTRDGRLA